MLSYIHFALGLILGALQASIKNPASLAKEKMILLEIRNLINELFPGE